VLGEINRRFGATVRHTVRALNSSTHQLIDEDPRSLVDAAGRARAQHPRFVVTPDELLSAARHVAVTPDRRLGTSRSTVVALVLGQALEGVLDTATRSMRGWMGARRTELYAEPDVDRRRATRRNGGLMQIGGPLPYAGRWQPDRT